MERLRFVLSYLDVARLNGCRRILKSVSDARLKDVKAYTQSTGHRLMMSTVSQVLGVKMLHAELTYSEE